MRNQRYLWLRQWLNRHGNSSPEARLAWIDRQTELVETAMDFLGNEDKMKLRLLRINLQRLKILDVYFSHARKS
jgi:transposase-like protein